MNHYIIMRSNEQCGYTVALFDPERHKIGEATIGKRYKIGEAAIGTFTADTDEEKEQLAFKIYNEWKIAHRAKAARELTRKNKCFTELLYERAIYDIFETAKKGKYSVVYKNVIIPEEVQMELEFDGYKIVNDVLNDYEITVISW